MFVAADPSGGDRSPDDFIEIVLAYKWAAEDLWGGIWEKFRFGLFLKGVVSGVEFFPEVFITDPNERLDF